MSAAAIDMNRRPAVETSSAAEPTSARGNLQGFEVQSPEPQRVDIKDTAARALSSAEAICRHWLPDGKRKGSEWVSRNPTRADKNPGSFSVSLTTGLWSDFATGDKGDLVALIAYLDGTSQGEAARTLADWLGVAPVQTAATAPKASTKPVYPVKPWYRKLGTPSMEWEYLDAAGAVLCVVQRYETTDSTGAPGKEFRPLTRTPDGWVMGAPAEPRPLYGLDRLAARPDAPVILAEGEKAADAAGVLLPDWVPIASMNGAKSPAKTDWAPLAGRLVRIWPDADAPGADFAQVAAELALAAGAVSAEILDLASLADELPKGWDAADALADGWTPERIAERARFVESPGTSAKSEGTEGTKGTAAAPASAAPTTPQAETLGLGEVERLLSWAWATGYTLPADPPGLFQSAADAAGNRRERLRVPLGVGGYQAPWASIAWRSGPVQFMDAVREYLPRRAAVVERKDAERIAKGKEPQGDIDEASLLEHASQWLARVRALQVSGDETQGMLSRMGTGDPGTPTAPLRVERVTEEDRQAPVPPEELFALTGALRSLYDHYAASARYRQPWFGVAAATATVAAVIGRSYAFRGTYANHMNVMVGPTGCGKDAPQALCEAALSAAGLGARIGPGSFASGAGIEDHMSHAPVTLWVLDELGKLLGSIGAGDQARAADIAGKLMRLYSASGRTYVGRALASHVRGEAPQPIRVINPITCVLGASTPEAMASALSAGDLESGLIGRLLFFVTHDVRPVRSEPSVSIEDIPEDFIAWARVAGPERMGGNLPNGAPTVKPDPPLSVPATPEASALLSDYADEIDDRLRALRDPAAISGVVRAAETASKFALIAAVSDDPEAPQITARHVGWGIAMSRHLSLSFTRAFADRIGGNPQHDALLRVRDLVFRARDFTGAHYRSATRNGLMPRAYLVKLSKLRARELNDVLGTLAEMGEVSSGIAKRSTHGHEGAVYWPTIAARVEVEA